MRFTLAIGAFLVLALPTASFAQKDNKHSKHHPKPPETAAVDFGILPLVPLGGAPCAQAPAVPPIPGAPVPGGPTDPCAYKLHVLVPDEVTIAKGGEVSFQVHGGGHGLAIYKVSKRTNREDIGEQLCPGDDPATLALPMLNACNATTPAGANANAKHVVTDARHDVVLVAETATAGHPHNRVWSEEGRLMSAGGHQFINGGTIPAGPTSNGQILTYQFLKAGRYLVICMNRSHFLNDWMFGFVDVEE